MDEESVWAEFDWQAEVDAQRANLRGRAAPFYLSENSIQAPGGEEGRR